MSTATKKPKVNLARIKKLSTLLALGLKDLLKQERAKNCAVNMGDWLVRSKSGVCVACLAGSVLKWSLGMRPTLRGIGPHEMGNDDIASRMFALNELRSGRVSEAARELGLPTYVPDRDVPYYSWDVAGWWTAMKQLLADLRKAGE
jgi:hypothetical protein